MPSLNFKSRFADKVERGEKRQSIRAMRKRPFKQGDTLYLYTGQRTKACRKLGEATCKGAEPIRIIGSFVVVNRRVLLNEQIESLARDDGFPDSHTFLFFFLTTYRGLPFIGQVIKW